jgi:hypothetical protein
MAGLDTALFAAQGFLILPVIPANQLAATRTAWEGLAFGRPRPEWATTAQPRMSVDLLEEEDGGGPSEHLAAALELVLGPIRETSAQLLGCAEPRLTNFEMFVEPAHEPAPPALPGARSALDGGAGTDPRNWHRDIRPDHSGPLALKQQAVAEQGPSYLQWNICLHSDGDDHLLVVPNSHNRLTSAAETAALARSPTAPLPGSIRAALRPGDGVVYLGVLHRGDRYTPREPRRTLHLGYEKLPPSRGGETSPQTEWHWRPSWQERLSLHAIRALEQSAGTSDQLFSASCFNPC